MLFRPELEQSLSKFFEDNIGKLDIFEKNIIKYNELFFMKDVKGVYNQTKK